jgi:hypothetical protein
MIIKGNVNGYNQDQFKLDFANHTCMEAIKKDELLNHVTLCFNAISRYRETAHPDMDNLLFTPRLVALEAASKFSVTPLYYLDFLLEKNPTSIVDIGCGANMFKRIIPCIHGIDPIPGNPHCDEIGSFDSEFSQAHTDEYESVFSINSMHFISLSYFENRLLEFINIVKPGGCGFVTFNTARMLELTSKEERQQLFGDIFPNSQTITDYVRCVIDNMTVKILVIDLFINQEMDEVMNGNIRLVFEK